MLSRPSLRRSRTTLLILCCALAAGCKKKPAAQTAQTAPPPPPATPAAAPPSSAASAAPGASANTDDAPAWISNPQITPETVVLTARDPKTLTPSELEFGVAPKRSPLVDYKPDVIVMEQGDKAIKSVATDGISWTFDANAPQVSDFQVGKIVFATGRAVGKVMALEKHGSTVTAILGPIQLEDVIERGRFVMDQALDADKMIAYVAPDWPGANDSTPPPTQTSSLDDDVASRGFAFVSSTTQGQALPGMPQGLPQVPQIPKIDPGPTRVTGPLPQVNVNNGDVRIENVENNTSVGVQYYYVPKKSKMGASASGLVSLQSPVVRCVLVIGKKGVDSAGISIKGAAGIRLSVNANSDVEKVINLHLQHFVPVDISIPLGGPVPLSLTFATFFNLNTAISAKSSLLASEGEYTFSGGVWAGRANGSWSVATPASFKAVKSMGNQTVGVSLGINSLTLAFGIRSMVGIGAFGFNTGVFATVRFGGSALLSPTNAFSCRRGTLGAYIDTGLGYQLPGFATAAINFFLTPITGHAIDAVGTLAKGPSSTLFTEDLAIPAGCASPKTG